jgi:hypothetical protein
VRSQVTFGSLGMHEFITNWVLQVQKKRLGPFVVGALDGGAIDLCLEKGYPAAGFGALTMNTTGAYWRQDEGIFLKMATLKTELLRCVARGLHMPTHALSCVTALKPKCACVARLL